jgi:DNA phosphorothioation-dependent restriction protein DptG
MLTVKDIEKFIKEIEYRVINERYEDLLYYIDKLKQKLKNINGKKTIVEIEDMSIKQLKEVKEKAIEKLHERGTII